MAVLVQANFPMQGPWGSEMAEAFRGLAESINAEPGLIWKVWIEDQTAGLSGGIYLFETREQAEAYVAMQTERLASFGITDVTVVYSDVNETLTQFNRASLNAV